MIKQIDLCQNAITKETFEAITAPWLKSLNNKDIVAVVSYPSSDRQRRLNTLINDTLLQKKYLAKDYRYRWLIIDLRITQFATVNQLEDYIFTAIKEKRLNFLETFKEKLIYLRKKKRLVLIVALIGAETLINQNRSDLLLWVIEMFRFDVLRSLLFFESNIFSQEAVDFFKKTPSFQPRIYFLKLYPKKDMEQFIKHIQKDHRWPLSLSEKIKKEIIRQSGGLILILREALWYLRDHPKASLFDIFHHPEMRFSLSYFWNCFSSQEKDLLQKIAKGEKISDIAFKPHLEYLLDTGLISPFFNSYKINPPLFGEYIKESVQLRLMPEVKGNDILLNGTYITSQLTKAERTLLRYLLSHPNQLANRDQIASLIWGRRANIKYSDWAIDSAISRLRKKLSQFGIPKNTIITKKGEGIVYKI